MQLSAAKVRLGSSWCGAEDGHERGAMSVGDEQDVPNLNTSEGLGAPAAQEPGDQAPKKEKRRMGRAISIRRSVMAVLLVALALSILALVAIRSVIKVNGQTMDNDARYMECETAIDDLRRASDFLTSQSRLYVMTGERNYLDAYLSEIYETDSRGRALAVLTRNLGSNVGDLEAEAEAGEAASRAALSAGSSAGQDALADLTDALRRSNELAKTELYAMRLAADAYGLEELPERLSAVTERGTDAELASSQKLARAKELVLGESYDELKSKIVADVDQGTHALIKALDHERVDNDSLLDQQLTMLQTIIVVLLIIVAATTMAIFGLVLKPLATYRHYITEGESLIPRGGQELRYLADAYNAMYAENHLRTAHLLHVAEHDPLTGLWNRGAYDEFMSARADEQLALVLIDIDYFKEFNDSYGHEVGDRVLMLVADAIKSSFRATDYPCRIGGDEFAVLMTGIDSSLRYVVTQRIDSLRERLLTRDDDLPPVTLSIGVAFSHPTQPEIDVFREADSALYEVKKAGRNGYAFYHAKRDA